MPYQFGARSANSFQTDPRRPGTRATRSRAPGRASTTIRRSSRALPGHGTAARTRFMRRSVFVNVPSFSAKLEAGNTTFACVRERLVEEEVLRDHELELREPLLDVVRVRLGLRRVLADQVQRLDPAVVQAGHHLVEPVPGALGQVDAPRGGELRAHLGVVARAGSRGGSAGSRPSRSGPGRCSGRAARSGRSTRSRGGRSSGRGSRATRCCRRRSVLGDPERVEDRRVPLGRVLARGRADRLRRDAGDALGLLGRVARRRPPAPTRTLRSALRRTRRSGGPPRGSRA